MKTENNQLATANRHIDDVRWPLYLWGMSESVVSYDVDVRRFVRFRMGLPATAITEGTKMPSENLLIVNGICPEVMDVPAFCLLVDLDEVRNGNVDVTVNRDFLIALGELACAD